VRIFAIGVSQTLYLQGFAGKIWFEASGYGKGVREEKEMKKEYLLKCQKCGAVMVSEGYHQYGWYLGNKRIEGACPLETKVRGEEVKKSPGRKGRGRTPSRVKPG